MHHSPSPSAVAAGRHAFAALVLANVVLAFGAWMVRIADVGPVAAGFWRLALAAPFLAVLARWSGGWSVVPNRRLLLLAGLGGLFFAADLGVWHYGIVQTKLANATLFANTSSFMFALYGFVVLRTMPGHVQLAAILLAAGGTALLLGTSYELSPDHLVGDLLSLLAGFFYTLYLIAIDRARRHLGALPVLTLATVAGAGPLLVAALLLGEPVLPGDWTPLLVLSLGSQVLGQGLLVYAIGHLSPVVIGLGLLVQPMVTALIGWLAYGEGFGAPDALGALLISVALVLVRLPARLATRRA